MDNNYGEINNHILSEWINFPHFTKSETEYLLFIRFITTLYPEPDNAAHILPAHFFNVYFNIIISFTPGSSKRPFACRFPHQHSYAIIFSVYHHLPCPFHSPPCAQLKNANSSIKVNVNLNLPLSHGGGVQV